MLPTQTEGLRQSLGPAQVVRQEPLGPQAKLLGQVAIEPGAQVPSPLQVPAVVSVVPVQVCGMQTALAGWRRQAPLPSRAPGGPRVDAAAAGRSVCGSWPAGAGEQVPARLVGLVMLHA